MKRATDRRHLLLTIILVAGCDSTNNSAETGGSLPDMEPRTVKFLIDNPNQLTKTHSECEAWKSSNRPAGSWPSVVTSNCSNAASASRFNNDMSKIKKTREKMGI